MYSLGWLRETKLYNFFICLSDGLQKTLINMYLSKRLIHIFAWFRKITISHFFLQNVQELSFKDVKVMHLAANNYEDFKATVIEYFGEVITLVTDLHLWWYWPKN